MVLLTQFDVCGQDLEGSFRNPPDTARPWVFWFWINGNISHEGITRDLEEMKRIGINGVLWMEVSGPWWAPQGKIETGSVEWHRAMQWAISEADRLGMEFALSVDCGYGSGGTHITPDISMQKLVWSATPVKGGKRVSVDLARPQVDYGPALKKAWFRPGQTLNPKVKTALQEVDSYRDVAVFAIRSSKKTAAAIPSLEKYDGRGNKRPDALRENRGRAQPLNPGGIVDLSERMSTNGQLDWSAPEGTWSVIRLGYASNFKMTRPVPSHLVGLECDRLHSRGIDAHFEHWLKPIIEGAGDRAGRTLKYIHIDSWEAGGQNWTKGFRREFRQRRGYDIGPWLPALTGRIVESVDKTERFLRDMRQTVNELLLDNYFGRLKELIEPYGIEFSAEPYGRLCVNNLDYASLSEFPIAEFWTSRSKPPFTPKTQPPVFPVMSGYWYRSMKGLASVANTYGKARVGAEAFTGCRGWLDHPYLIKAMGDEAFCEGISHYIYHLYAHQAYEHMRPGLTHRRWGQHINRHQTWWPLSKPHFDYVGRCQSLLRQGRKVADIACLYYEGAPLSFNNVPFHLPPGYDYDLCTTEIVGRMTAKNGRLHLPNGMSYRYLALPGSGRLTLKTARKVEALRRSGGAVYQQVRIVGTPGLDGYPEADEAVRNMAKDWPMIPKGGWPTLMAGDRVKPDFEGGELHWIHRRVGNDSIYFIANGGDKPVKQNCTFRIVGKTAELWDPETGEIFALPDARQSEGRTVVELSFGPARSWFVVFRDKPTPARAGRTPFPSWKTIQEIAGDWNLRFDSEWGTDRTLTLDALSSWSEHSDPLVKYYSGIAIYRTVFDFPKSNVLSKDRRLCLDLGRVEAIARVTLNGKNCGIAWKPPYRVDITEALQPGRNELRIEVANTWVNRMIGDEHLPLDARWDGWEVLLEWPKWFKDGNKSPTGRYTFTSARHYTKDSELRSAGLLGPVRVRSGD